MKDFFIDIIEYQHRLNALIINQMLESATKLPERAHLLMCHSINAHQIWNARILDQKTFGVFERYFLQEMLSHNNTNLSNTIQIINSIDLTDSITYQNTKGVSFTNTVRDILFHISNHYSHHRGQIIAKLKQAGIAPIVSDYIIHRRTAME